MQSKTLQPEPTLRSRRHTHTHTHGVMCTHSPFDVLVASLRMAREPHHLHSPRSSWGQRERAVLLPSGPQGQRSPPWGLIRVATKGRQPGAWKKPPGPPAAPEAELVTRAGVDAQPRWHFAAETDPEKSGHRDGEPAAGTDLGLLGLGQVPEKGPRGRGTWA